MTELVWIQYRNERWQAYLNISKNDDAVCNIMGVTYLESENNT